MTTTEIAILEPASLVPTDVFAPGGIDAIIAKVETEVRAAAADLDISTPKGRKDIASLAYKVARSKTALDDMGKDLVSGIKKQAAAIDEDRRKARERLDALRDEVRRPLDEYEAAEAARVRAHEAALAAIVEGPGYGQAETAAEIAARLEWLRNFPARDWQEFRARAEKALADEIRRMERLLHAATKREEEAAELARLRREEEERLAREAAERAEREQREREDRAAEQARIAAEEKARREREELERRAKEERERAERQAREAEQRAADAERRAQEAAEKAERDRIAAEERARQEAEAAARRERERIEAERRAEEEATRRREADKAHRAAINNAAVAALVAAGLSEPAAKTAVIAIARGDVPAVAIRY